jgi:hypothetical protein
MSETYARPRSAGLTKEQKEALQNSERLAHIPSGKNGKNA